MNIQDQNEILIIKPNDNSKDNILPNNISSYKEKQNESSLMSVGNSGKNSISKDRIPGINLNNLTAISLKNKDSQFFDKSATSMALLPYSEGNQNPENSDKTFLIFQPNPLSTHNYTYKSHTISFGVKEDDVITTYFIGHHSVTEFTFPEKIEEKNNGQQKLYFLPRTELQFNSQDLKNSEIKSFDKYEQFVEELNALLNLDEINNYYSNMKSKKIFLLAVLYIIICVYLCLIIVIIIEFTRNKINQMVPYIIVAPIITILFIYGVKYIISSIRDIPVLKREFLIIKLIYQYDKVEDFTFNWNKTFFNTKGINILIPPTLNYVMFNMNPNIELFLKPHPFEKIKKRKPRRVSSKKEPEVNF